MTTTQSRWAVRTARLRDARREARIVIGGRLVTPEAPHGTRDGYSGWCCRCQSCTSAWATYIRNLRMKRLATRIEGDDGYLIATAAPRHGTVSTYANSGCRCRPCVMADIAYRRERYGRVARLSAARMA